MLGKKTSNRGRNPLVWLAPDPCQSAKKINKHKSKHQSKHDINTINQNMTCTNSFSLMCRMGFSDLIPRLKTEGSFADSWIIICFSVIKIISKMIRIFLSLSKKAENWFMIRVWPVICPCTTERKLELLSSSYFLARIKSESLGFYTDSDSDSWLATSIKHMQRLFRRRKALHESVI